MEQSKEFFNGSNIPLFLDYRGRNWITKTPDRIFLHNTTIDRRFARDCSWSLYYGQTVTYVAMQLAFHMGFTKVALVGCDHEFQTKGPPNKVVQAEKTDPDHFDPDYFSNVPWQLPDLFESEISYRMADKAYRASGRMLVNATEGGRLEALPRMKLNDFLELEQTYAD